MSRRVGSGKMVSTSPPSFGGDRARTPPKLESNGTREDGAWRDRGVVGATQLNATTTGKSKRLE